MANGSELVDVGGDIIIRRIQAREDAREKARAAVESIRANRAGHILGEVTIRELIDEGRR